MNNFSDLGKVFLAPMAGFTDDAMRSLCISFGADRTFSEMISASGLSHNNKNTHAMLAGTHPCSIQLFGKDSVVLSDAAKRLSDDENVLAIDLNMGCPAPKIVKNGEGCALMQNISLASKIVSDVRKNTHLPLSVKFRSGFDEKNINAYEFAKMCEDNGCDFITVHARTRNQFYSGSADLEIIAKVKSLVKIPVVGNGDITDAETAKNMFDKTNADAIMVGRGAIGNPFIFEEIKAGLDGDDYAFPALEKKIEVASAHLQMMTEIYGELNAVKKFRKHAAHYISGIKNASEYRRMINTASTASEVKSILFRLAENEV